MKTLCILRWLLPVWFFCVVGSASAQPSAPPDAGGGESLEGFWKGRLKVPGGELEVIFRLVRLTNGAFYATLDVPQQKVSRMEVKVDVRSDTLMLAAEQAGSRFVGRVSADGKQAQGEWTQPGYRVPMLLAHSAPPISTAPAARLTPPYREEEVEFTSSDTKLRFGGMLTVPAGEGPFPAVVLLSDGGAQDRDGTVGEYHLLGALGDYLTRRGIAVLRFDDRGVGHSTGTSNTATITDQVNDAQAAMTFLRTRPEINASKLGLIGHGEGGNVALLTAAEAQPPAFVVTLAAHGLPGKTLVLEQQAGMLRSLGMDKPQIDAAVKQQLALLDIIQKTPDANQARPIIANMLRQTNPSMDEVTAQASAAELATPRYQEYLSFNPTADLAKVKCPVLLLNGTTDLYVMPDANLSALTKALKSNKAVSSRKLPGVNHLFQSDPSEWPLVNGVPRETFSPAAQETIRAWIVELVGPMKKPQ